MRLKVIWLFERAGRTVRLEMLYLAPDKYELRFLDADGAEHIEEFTNATDAGHRQIELLHTLSSQGWNKTGEWKV